MKTPNTTELLTLIARPADAPCCVKLEDASGKSCLFQTDWDWPSLAGNFGFRLASVQCCDKCGKVSTGLRNSVVQFCRYCPDTVGNIGANVGFICHHDGTDGTIDCPCGVKAGDFIHAAREFLDENDGATCENPGYELE